MALSWDFKDPDEVLDYEIDWTARLAGDTISTSVWTIPSGITEGSSGHSNTTTTTKIWLQGGTAGTTYEVLNRITTAGLRTMDQTVKLKIKSK